MYSKLFFLINILVVSFTVIKTDAAKILVYFPFPSISHQIVYRPLTHELAKRGHEVTIITTDPEFKKGESIPNITEIDVHDVSYEIWRKDFVTNVKGESENAMNVLKVAVNKLIDIFEVQIQTKQVAEIMKTKKYDLVIVEACVSLALVLSYVFNAPLIQFSSVGSLFFNNEAVGSPSHPIIYPELSAQRLYNHSYWEKIAVLRIVYESRIFHRSLEPYENAMLKKYFGPNTPTLSELKNNVDMLFLNINPAWDNNRPMPPNVIHIGGIHLRPNKELPNDLKTYLDSSKHGVIYMSFGSNVDPTLLPSERIQIFCKVFSRLKYDVLWKWNSDELPGRPKNVRISKWLPQIDILSHPKIKLFITQGGLQSTDESISAGVPLIAFPMMTDQWYNAEKYVYHKIGLKMDIKKITDESLEESINKVINDPSYRTNIKRLGVVMRDQPQSPLERAVWWTEYVLRHGGAKHLRSPAANISWTEYLMLDVVAAVFIILFLTITFSVLCTYYIYKKLRSIVVVKLKVC